MKDMSVEAQRWWRQAISDFEFLPKVKKLGKYDTCCFLAQQVSEKALKAFLFSKGEELIFTHSIFKLCEMATLYNPEFIILKEKVKRLDYYYVEARYPNAIEDVIPAEFYSIKDAQEAIKLTSTVMTMVEKYYQISHGKNE
jgi:HEPN domain-containing protein